MLLAQQARALALLGEADRAGEVLMALARDAALTGRLETVFVDAARALARRSNGLAAVILAEARAKHAAAGAIARVQGDVVFRMKSYALAVDAYRAALALLPDGAARANTSLRLGESLKALGLPPEEQTATPVEAMARAPALKSKIFRVCAITNVYNESFDLPIWLRHYGAQVGIRNCVVLDHGTDDGSTDDLRGAGVMRLPRGPVYDERHRMRLITDLANNMLNYYDAVLYSDCDEMLVADPARWEDLTEYCQAMHAPTVHAIGLNLRQDITREGPIRTAEPVLAQRSRSSWARCANCSSPARRSPGVAGSTAASTRPASTTSTCCICGTWTSARRSRGSTQRGGSASRGRGPARITAARIST